MFSKIVLRCVFFSLLSTPLMAAEFMAASAQAVPADVKVVPIEHEPNHRLALKSPSIRVFDAYFPAGSMSLYHSHRADSVLICLDGADVTSEEPGKTLAPRPPIPAGLIYYRPYAREPFVHRVNNRSSAPFRILDIELLKASGKPFGLATLPAISHLNLENERVRVSTIHLDPGQSSGSIAFSSVRLLAATTAGTFSLSTETASGTSSRTVHADKGMLDMKEGNKARETIVNTGDTPLDIVVTEVK